MPQAPSSTSLKKKYALLLILGGAAPGFPGGPLLAEWGRALQRCGNRIVSNAALQFAEKLDFGLVFGWRSGLPLRSTPYFQCRL
jgi:hypothetical protein